MERNAQRRQAQDDKTLADKDSRKSATAKGSLCHIPAVVKCGGEHSHILAFDR